MVVQSLPLYPRGGLKWRDNYSEGPGHPVTPNYLGIEKHRHDSSPKGVISAYGVERA